MPDGCADSFGRFGGRARQTPAQRAARMADRLVTVAIVLVLGLAAALSGYSLWDSYQVTRGADAIKDSGLSFAELRAINPDVVAWLTLDGTGIDYPVCKGEDDFEYLSKNAKGEPSASGSIFLDAACDENFTEPYEVVMGHHMEGGKMFGDLEKFLKRKFFDAHRTGTLKLSGRTLSLEVCAVLTADAYDGAIYGVPVQAAGMDRVISRIDELATRKRGEGPKATDQLVALSTCSSDGPNARTVVVCRVTGAVAANNA